MNLSVKHLVIIGLAVVALGACGRSPNFSDVSGKEWLLVEIQTQPQNIVLDRDNLKADGFEKVFTLNFDTERLSGMGAPNRYFAPFALEKNQIIKIQPIAGTLMAPIREPEQLKERQFFDYLQNAYKWNFTKEGRFELYSKDGNGTEAVLIFNL